MVRTSSASELDRSELRRWKTEAEFGDGNLGVGNHGTRTDQISSGDVSAEE